MQHSKTTKILTVLLCLMAGDIVWSDSVKSYEDERLYRQVSQDNTKFAYKFYIDNCVVCKHKAAAQIRLQELQNSGVVAVVDTKTFDSKISNNIHILTKSFDGNHLSNTWVTNEGKCLKIKSEYTNRSNLIGHTYKTSVEFMDKDNNIIKNIEQQKGVDAKFFGGRNIENVIKDICLPNYIFTHITKVKIRHDLPIQNKTNDQDGLSF